MKSNVNATFIVFLVLGDFFAIMAAFTVAYIMRVVYATGPYIPITSLEYAKLFALLTPIWLGIFAVLGLYNFNVFEWRFKEFGRLILGSFIGIMTMITYEFGINKPIFPARIVAVYAFIIACLLLILERTIVRSLRLLARSRGVGIARTMLIGESQYTYSLLDSLRNPRRSGYEVVSVVGAQHIPSWYKGGHTKDLDKALSQISDLNIHTIVLSGVYQDETINEKILTIAQENHCGFRFVPAQDSMYSATMEVELFQGTPLLRVHPTPLFGIGRIFKRAFDVVFSLLALIVFSPIMFIIYISLLFAGGSPIYRRKRLTRYGNSFDIFKFRSLKTEFSGLDPEAGFAKLGRPELIKEFRKNGDMLDDDPRISRLGNIIRPTSLDELPQLFNVLKGDISLVGPRALIEEELNQFPQKNLILSIKSGLTGLAVISGRRDIPFEERRQIDLYYVQNWSFWLDIKIIFRTILAVLSRRGTA